MTAASHDRLVSNVVGFQAEATRPEPIEVVAR